MDDTQRGALFVQREKTEVAIGKLKDELKWAGELLSTLGRRLANDPGSISFTNAPGPLNIMPPDSFDSPPIDWRDIPEKKFIAEKVEALRRLEDKLEGIQRKLRG